jgi:hypothetical protein
MSHGQGPESVVPAWAYSQPPLKSPFHRDRRPGSAEYRQLKCILIIAHQNPHPRVFQGAQNMSEISEISSVLPWRWVLRCWSRSGCTGADAKACCVSCSLRWYPCLVLLAEPRGRISAGSRDIGKPSYTTATAPAGPAGYRNRTAGHHEDTTSENGTRPDILRTITGTAEGSRPDTVRNGVPTERPTKNRM